MNQLLVGPVTPNHPAYAVRKGQLENAVKFFQDVLGWVYTGHVVSGAWGEAKFVLPRVGSSLSIQLTDENDRSDRPVTYPGAHFGVNVDIAGSAARGIRSWATIQGYKCHIEPANPDGTKWFIQINELFTFQFELVSRPVCPSCHGQKEIPLMHKGMAGPNRLCPTCKGSGVDRSV